MPDVDTVLFVDDEPDVRLAARQTLDLAGWKVILCASAVEARAALTEDFPGIVVTDVRMPGDDGLTLLRQLVVADRDLPVVLITGHGDVPMAVEAMHAGAYDFIEKPYRGERLTGTVARALEKRRLVLENRILRRQLTAADVIESRLLGQSPVMQEVRGMVAAAAAVDADVLILGETGTGKEVVARCIHEASNRRNGRFVALNCGAMPETMIESELFGHEAGSFTGATGRRIGKLEHASGGTLFLDEIESMPLTLQVRLLRALQERSIERLGSNTAIALDLRVVAATKVDLRDAANQGSFREDLYYRLDVLSVTLPPLRARGDDMALLFRHFVHDSAARYGREAPPLPADLAARLLAHRWPGNVRELRNAAERFVLLDGRGPLLPGGEAPAMAAATGDLPLPERVGAFEKALIVRAMTEARGDIIRAAADLGVPRKTLYDKLRKYDLERSQFGGGNPE